MFLLPWAGLVSPALLGGSYNGTLAHNPRRGPDLQWGGGISSQTLLVLSWDRGKNGPFGFFLWTDEDKGLFVVDFCTCRVCSKVG